MDIVIVIGGILLFTATGFLVRFLLSKGKTKDRDILQNGDLNYLIGVIIISLIVYIYKNFK